MNEFEVWGSGPEFGLTAAHFVKNEAGGYLNYPTQCYFEVWQAARATTCPGHGRSECVSCCWPKVSEFGEPYQGAREDLAIWKRRALEAESRIREQDLAIVRLGDALNAENGPSFLGEPVAQSAVLVPREDVENFLAEYHAVVWATAEDEQVSGSYDEAGREIAKVFLSRFAPRAVI